jgi:hypothetical protein
MIVDGESVRHAARQAHEKVRAMMEEREQEIQSFERQELPAYQRWVHLNFGQLLTELRETESAAADKEAILERIENYQTWNNMSPLRAYAKVKSEMENPDCDPKAGSADPDGAAADFDGLSDEDEDDAFLRSYYETAKARYEHDTGFEAPDFESFKYAMGFPNKQSKSGESKADSEKARIKKLYRRIARSLHPDCCDQFSLREQRLWHRAQEAYKAGDAIALETVLAHIEAAASGPLFVSSVSDLLRDTRKMRTRVDYLEADLDQARRHPAWRFTQKNPNQLDSMGRRVGKEISQALNKARVDLASALETLRGLEFAYARSVARKRPSSKAKAGAAPSQQASFDF